ncbi:plasmid recombination protein [Pseudolabrys sp. Root1462]|uniref:plasmid recombination protein n=1 Tax=Pseudolabrys sp. Root1462 TaxID=1736466 RepID=UPI0012E37F5F|nr:plasmid recombination protein [Pseudolabrys sp. Root1462]
MKSYQFLHLGSCGRFPRSGEPSWSCIEGITAEGARSPGASNHIRYPAQPKVIDGVSPIEAGRLAIERADQARDEGKKLRRLRRDGVCLLAGVVSYPWDHQSLCDDPVDSDVYSLWQQMVLAWLRQQFGHHLKSVVEHRDERYPHLHFYVVPDLRDDGRLDINQVHPGRRAKAAAAADGAEPKHRDRAYRQGMRQWQDTFHRDVSAFFRHERSGPRRQRVNRLQWKMEQAIAAKEKSMLEKIEKKRDEVDYDTRKRAWERYAAPYRALQQDAAVLAERYGTEEKRRRAAEAECVALRERLAALEPAAAPRPAF